MSTKQDRIASLIFSMAGLAIALYAILADSHSDLLPRGLAWVWKLLVVSAGAFALLLLVFAFVRKTWVYAIGTVAWSVALVRLLALCM